MLGDVRIIYEVLRRPVLMSYLLTHLLSCLPLRRNFYCILFPYSIAYPLWNRQVSDLKYRFPFNFPFLFLVSGQRRVMALLRAHEAVKKEQFSLLP